MKLNTSFAILFALFGLLFALPVYAQAPFVSSLEADEGGGYSGDFTIVFNEAVSLGASDVLLRDANDDSILRAINVSSSELLFSNDRFITVTPDPTLPPATLFYVEVPEGFATDNEGTPSIAYSTSSQPFLVCVDALFVGGEDDFTGVGENMGNPVSDGDDALWADSSGETVEVTIGTDAFFSLSEALAVACSGAVIRIAPGTYTEGSTIQSFRNATIIGDCTEATVFSGANTHQILEANSSLTLLSLAFRDGNSGSNPGGAIRFSGGSSTIINCEFSGNVSSTFGGAVAVLDTTLDCVNTTFSGNSSGGLGGAIFTEEARLSLELCSILNNTISTGSGPSGLLISDAFLPISITNCLIIADDDRGTIDADLTLNNFQVENNIIGDLTSNQAVSNSNVLLENSGEQLSTIVSSNLTNNGGPTLTHAILRGGPAFDAGNNSLISRDEEDLDSDDDRIEAIPFEQRGESFERILNGTVDIGAFEADPTRVTTTLVCDGDFVRLHLEEPGIVGLDEIVVTANGLPLAIDQALLNDVDPNTGVSVGSNVDVGITVTLNDVPDTAYILGNISFFLDTTCVVPSDPGPTVSFTDQNGDLQTFDFLVTSGTFTSIGAQFPEDSPPVVNSGAELFISGVDLSACPGDTSLIEIFVDVRVCSIVETPIFEITQFDYDSTTGIAQVSFAGAQPNTQHNILQSADLDTLQNTNGIPLDITVGDRIDADVVSNSRGLCTFTIDADTDLPRNFFQIEEVPSGP